MGGDGKGKGGGKGAGAPKPKPKAAGKSKEELEEERKRMREERQAAQAKKVAEEKAHMEWVANLTTFEASSIDGVDWSKVEKQLLLNGGTSLYKMADGKVASVRRVDSPGMEMMATSAATELGLKVGAFRAVPPADAEYTAIEEMTARTKAYLEDMSMDYETFVKEVREGNAGEIPDEQKRLLGAVEFTDPTRATGQLDFSQKKKGTVFVREFQKGKTLNNLAGSLSTDDLQSMGKLAVLGVLLNAEDMSPLPIWRESGGLSHALKLLDNSAILPLDLRIKPLKGEELAEYAKRVEMMSSWLLGKKSKPADLEKYPPFTEDEIKNSFAELLKGGGFEVGDLGSYLDGIKASLKNVADSYTSGALPKALAEALGRASKTRPFAAWGTGPSAAECAAFLTATAAAIAGDLGPSTKAGPTFYGFGASQPTRACLLLLREAGVDHEYKYVDLNTGENRKEPYISINPTGFVPTLKDGDLVLGEGAAILKYIAETNGLTNWWPEDDKARANVDYWLHWNHTSMRKSTEDMVWQAAKGEKTNSLVVKKSLDIMDQHLAKAGPFLTGATPTLADLMILPEVDQIQIFKFFDLSPWPKVQEWLAAMIAALPQSYDTTDTDAIAKMLGVV